MSDIYPKKLLTSGQITPYVLKPPKQGALIYREVARYNMYENVTSGPSDLLLSSIQTPALTAHKRTINFVYLQQRDTSKDQAVNMNPSNCTIHFSQESKNRHNHQDLSPKYE